MIQLFNSCSVLFFLHFSISCSSFFIFYLFTLLWVFLLPFLLTFSLLVSFFKELILLSLSEVENNFVLITYIFSFLSVICLSHLFVYFSSFHSQLNLNLPFWFNHLTFLFSISLICIILHYPTVCV